MRLIISMIILSFGLVNCENNSSHWNRMEATIQKIIDNAGGTVAVAFEDLTTGKTLFFNERVSMHAASTMKTPVMIEVFNQVQQGKFKLEDEIVIKNEFRSIIDGSLYAIPFDEGDSVDIVYQHIGENMTIHDLVFQMITVSSNLATNILIDMVGASNVMKTMNSIGVEKMQVLRGVEDEKAYRQGLNNTTDAYDLLLVMKAIALKQVVSPEACEQMIGILAAQKYRDKIPKYLPQTVTVANKTGHITEIDHDAAIVYRTPDQPYVLVILTSGIDDHANAQEICAQISLEIYKAISES